MEQNNTYHLIWPAEYQTLPPTDIAIKQVHIANVLLKKAPHLLTPEKHSKPNISLPIKAKLFSGKHYPFKKGQQKPTKNSVVWTDYVVSTWPLLLYLLRNNPDETYEDILLKYFDINQGCHPKWESIAQLAQTKGTDTLAVDLDELDSWYDEISLTHIAPQSYHELYKWFGTELREIGYLSFDFFMTHREGSKAWHQAIMQHLNEIDNLPGVQAQTLFEKYLKPLLLIV
ncbi:hypothetical protein [Carboxylicivirga taeanensis]|uniref:hypothetical protein n=1 Tax=Carboxylicivirga taeanensis TaxID=1416875 RepID=UPI003F6E09FE